MLETPIIKSSIALSSSLWSDPFNMWRSKCCEFCLALL